MRLRDGCLLLNDALIVWPREARLDLSTPGRIAINDEQGPAIVSEYLSPTGGIISGRIDSPLLEPCAGRPVFLVNGFEPITPQAWAELQHPARRTRPAPPPGSSPRSLDQAFPYRGRWVVIAINGRARPPGDPPITVGLGPDRIEARSQCIPWRWTVLPSGERPRTRLTNGSEPVCDRMQSPWEQAFEAAMSSAAEFQLRGADLRVIGDAEVVLRPADREEAG